MVHLDEKILARLEEQIATGEQLLRTKRDVSGWGAVVDRSLATQWCVSCLHILGTVFGRESDHYTEYAELKGHISSYIYAESAQAVLKAAQDDYTQGMLFDARTLIEAEVFSDFLEQADYLLQHSYAGPAAVIASAVMEDGMRKLCDRHGVQLAPNATLAPMNDALAKKGAYTKLVHDKLMPVIRLRNHAAHGEWDQFTAQDVQGMIDAVRDFMAQHFS